MPTTSSSPTRPFYDTLYGDIARSPNLTTPNNDDLFMKELFGDSLEDITPTGYNADHPDRLFLPEDPVEYPAVIQGSDHHAAVKAFNAHARANGYAYSIRNSKKAQGVVAHVQLRCAMGRQHNPGAKVTRTRMTDCPAAAILHREGGPESQL